MNKVILMGRLTKDPDIKNGEKPVAKFSLAIDRKFNANETDYPSIVAFGKTAEFVSKYLHKGMKIVVEGRLQTGSYEKDGRKIYTTDVIADSIEFAESKKEPQETGEEWIAPDDIEDGLPFK